MFHISGTSGKLVLRQIQFSHAITISQTSIGAGIYRVAKTLDGCTKYSEPITVTAYPKPETPQISFANDTVCEGAIWPVSISNTQSDREYSYIVNGTATGWTLNTNININTVGAWQTASAPTMLPTKQLRVVASKYNDWMCRRYFGDSSVHINKPCNTFAWG